MTLSHTRMTTCWLLLLVLVLVLGVVFAAPETQKDSGYLVHVSDWHYDPLYNSNYNPTTNCRAPLKKRWNGKEIIEKFADDFSEEEKERQQKAAEKGRKLLKQRRDESNSSPYGVYGCDSPLTLVDATMDELKSVAPNPDWVFVTGDYAAHGLTGIGNYTSVAMQYVTNSLESVYPQASIYFCFGNNDVPETNYQIDCSSSWFSQTYEIWQSYIPFDQKETFLTMGAYRTNLSLSYPPPSSPAPSPLWLVVLNTLFYSTRSNHKGESDPCGQFEWLSTQLQEAKDQGAKVYLMSHIMPGIDSFKFVSLWEDDFNEKFFDTIMPYRDLIVGEFYGHVHNDEYRAYNGAPSSARKKSNDPLFNGLVNSAVSPVYGNNPNFRVATYSKKNFTLLDYDMWAMDLVESNSQAKAMWSKLYSFQDAYQVGSPDQNGIRTLNTKLYDKYDTFKTWYEYRSSGSNVNYAPDVNSPGWGCLLCAMDSEGMDDFDDCIGNMGLSSHDCSKVN